MPFCFEKTAGRLKISALTDFTCVEPDKAVVVNFDQNALERFRFAEMVHFDILGIEKSFAARPSVGLFL